MGLRVRKLVTAVVFFGVIAGAAAWFLTKPEPWPASHWDGLGEPDIANGEQIFWAGAAPAVMRRQNPRVMPSWFSRAACR